MTCNVWRDGVQVVSIQLLTAVALGLLADLVAINEHARLRATAMRRLLSQTVTLSRPKKR